MTRTYRNLLALVLGLFLGGFATWASADSIPAINGGVQAQTRCVTSLGGSTFGAWYSTIEAACSASGGNYRYVSSTGSTQCWETSNWLYPSGYYTCQSGSNTVYSCPSGQNWTLDGTNCTRPDCVSPQVRQANGTCAAPPCASGTASSASRYIGTFATGSGQSVYGVATAIPSSLCDGACSGTPQAVTSCDAGTAAQGSPVSCTYAITLNGSTCSGGNGSAPVDPTIAAPAPPCASGQGAISNSAGKVVCVNQGSDFQGATYPPKENKTTSTESHPDGSTKTTTNIQTCTGAGACSTSTTTTITGATAGGAGTAGTPGTTTTGIDKPKSETSDFCAQNPSLQFCKGGMNEEATQKQVRDELKKLTTPDVSDDSAITSATHSPQSQADLEAENLKSTLAATGQVDPTSSNKSAWSIAMETGWFAAIPSSSCAPFVSNFGGKVWTLDICPTAAKISEWGSWAWALLAAFSVWAMVTRGNA